MRKIILIVFMLSIQACELKLDENSSLDEIVQTTMKNYQANKNEFEAIKNYYFENDFEFRGTEDCFFLYFDKEVEREDEYFKLLSEEEQNEVLKLEKICRSLYKAKVNPLVEGDPNRFVLLTFETVKADQSHSFSYEYNKLPLSTSYLCEEDYLENLGESGICYFELDKNWTLVHRYIVIPPRIPIEKK